MGLFDKVLKPIDSPVAAFPPVAPPHGAGGVLPIQDVYNLKGVGIVVVGKIQSGEIYPGQRTSINGKEATAAIIEMHHKRLSVARTGDNVGINLKGIEKNDVKRGDTLFFHH